MSDFDIASFRTKLEALSNDQLIALVTINAKYNVSEAVDIANREVERRGLTDDVQKVHFDVFLNHSGFAGRLILLDEQLLYLSTGMRAASAPGGLASEVHQAERRVAAKRLDFTALDNEGSWIYYLDEIKTCETKTSLLSGKELILDAQEEDGSVTHGVIKCTELSKEDFIGLAVKITEAKSKFEQSAKTTADQ